MRVRSPFRTRPQSRRQNGRVAQGKMKEIVKQITNARRDETESGRGLSRSGTHRRLPSLLLLPCAQVYGLGHANEYLFDFCVCINACALALMKSQNPLSRCPHIFSLPEPRRPSPRAGQTINYFPVRSHETVGRRGRFSATDRRASGARREGGEHVVLFV